ncbi:hypothetical protein CFIO01_03835 [Colletotrichum fioriniae PJ7]|uniref:Uncharacterized protein n=1 Tax=Colletotrichum fioriniae PJ7 TaxID=1445577 RepID=A0A010RMH7_9PEZI|nr:hypothetical protein CFIO01_03835 [Colletotrichum fioriniae PJ7]
MRALKFPVPDGKDVAKTLSNIGICKPHYTSERPFSLNNGDPFVKVDEGELVYTPTPPSKPRLATWKGYSALHEPIEASKGEDKGPSAYAS